MLGELRRHELGVLNADTETEGAHRGRVISETRYFLHDLSRPSICTGVQAAQCLNVVALAATPGDVGEVESVVDAEIHEGREALLVDGIPQPQFGGNAIIEPVKDRQVVAAFRCGRKPKDLTRLHVVKDLSV